MIQYPKNNTLSVDSPTSMLTAEQVAISLRGLLRPFLMKGKQFQFKLHHTSGLQGEEGEQYAQASALFNLGHWRWCFFVRGGSLTNCYQAMSPKGGFYDLNTCGGNVFTHLSIPDQQALTALIIPEKKAEAPKDNPKEKIRTANSLPFRRRTPKKKK